MRLVRVAVAVVVCLLCAQSAWACVAQEASQKKPPSQKKAQVKAPASTALKWEQLAEGVKILRLHKRAASKREIVILLLADNKYADFKQDPDKFINETHRGKIFPGVEKTTVEKDWKEFSKKKSAPGDDWAVMLGHDPTCLSAVFAVEDF